MSNEEWSVQVSIKHGPVDDRGNPLHMTNVRGHTARDVRDQIADLAEHADRINAGIAEFAGSTAAIPRQRQADSQTASRDAGGGKRCAHGPREYKSGSKKDGSKWEGWFCPAPSKAEQCAVSWVD